MCWNWRGARQGAVDEGVNCRTRVRLHFITARQARVLPNRRKPLVLTIIHSLSRFLTVFDNKKKEHRGPAKKYARNRGREAIVASKPAGQASLLVKPAG